MCHHYSVEKDSRELAELFEVLRLEGEFPREWKLFPLSLGPVIRLDSQGERELVSLQWGLLPAWWKPSARSKSRQAFQRKCFNARSETVHEKPTFRRAFQQRRCLVPFSQFEENRCWFQSRTGAPLAFAGLWERWSDGVEHIESYCFLTTEPNSLISQAGHHRMPVILATPECQARWLNPDLSERPALEDLLLPDQEHLIRLHAAE